MITVTLPYPISANRYWNSFKLGNRMMVAPGKEAKKYKAEVAKILAVAGVRKPIIGRIAFTYVLYPHRPLDYKTRMRKHGDAWSDTVQCIDLDNAQKVLLDSLKGIAFEDDAWVRRIYAERAEPDGEARVVVTITPIAPVVPQAALDLPAAPVRVADPLDV